MAAAPSSAKIIGPPSHPQCLDVKDSTCLALSTHKSFQFASKIHAKRALRPPSGRLWSKWRELQGADNWLGLLLPSPRKAVDSYQDGDAAGPCSDFIDEELRREILKYGDLSQACYDGFDNDDHSRRRGNCRYSPSELLGKTVAARDQEYEITKYLYATTDLELPRIFPRPRARDEEQGEPWSRDSNWMGFVAVSRPSLTAEIGRRHIVIAWRGTVTGVEWLENLQDYLMPVGLDPRDRSTAGVKVESGFLDIYTASKSRSRYNKLSARQQLICELRRLIAQFQADGEAVSVTVTGHSLGGALALLSAYDLAELGIAGDKTQIPATVVSFSAPRVGNRCFAARCRELDLKVLRVVNTRDIVPKVPGIFVNEQHQWMSGAIGEMIPWAYSHVGTEVALDCGVSPYLRRGANLAGWHNLEGLLHLVDGYRGPYRGFEPSGRRDLALVNKDSDLLDPSLGIPSFWGSKQPVPFTFSLQPAR
ncbi:phospholipase A1-Igamma2, chloroplastic-like [Selaginella moellendorffii]|uniref:phospholipase A1-Igamma2, chloroplastic-like n=1 Tax=Selaginella moellendorffii TaxID=88036 RepID=UPI000D1D0DE8|nr:phospholipase A1-Igamma2, chloroplastic-like [Selaginella moellendorffii]|eukprot:XP_024526530.1 phospholipase A1-Igamma2, chloroplastic-like [Selaginella moellendorffii]